VEDLVEIVVGIVGDVTVRDHGPLASAAGRPQGSAFTDQQGPVQGCFSGQSGSLASSIADALRLLLVRDWGSAEVLGCVYVRVPAFLMTVMAMAP
jgi:hypothetical protein